jgi:hypothetical protein
MKALVLIRPFLLLLFYCSGARAQSISGVVNSNYQVTAINTIANTVTLTSTSGLSVGTKVLMIQMKGATINAGNVAGFGDITAINNAGNYEFNYVCSITGNDVFLKYQIVNAYTIAGLVQLVSVPVYSSVTISGTLSANPWNPITGTGGVVVIEATNTIFLNSNIDVSGLGFQGGVLQNYPVPPYDCTWAVNVTDYFLSIPPSDTYHTGGRKGEGITDYIVNKEYGRGKLSNGGGGGNNNNTGGAGGGNYGIGGNGGNRSNEGAFNCHGTNPGIGGLSLSTYAYTLVKNRIFLGGGGGGGHENNAVGMPGGNGGGIVILTAGLITGSGTSIIANGLSPLNPGNSDPTTAEGDGGGGGGAGGTIILNATAIGGNINALANGARGTDASNMVNDCTGPGGGGGAGVIWSSGASIPAAVTGSVSGGSNGVVSAGSSIAACRGSANGATAGANGNMQPGYIPPMGVAEVCATLALSELDYFRGNLNNEKVRLTWGLNQTDDILTYQPESSYDRINYTSLANVGNEGKKAMEFDDLRSFQGTMYYRLKITFKNGSSVYSEVVPINRIVDIDLQWLTIQPNPVQNNLSLVVYAKKMLEGRILIYNAYGQKLLLLRQKINSGYSTIEVPVSGMAEGAYVLMLEGNGATTAKPFLKIR